MAARRVGRHIEDLLREADNLESRVEESQARVKSLSKALEDPLRRLREIAETTH